MTKRIIFWLVGLGIALGITGCGGDELARNTPWTKARNWESGLPSSMTEGR